MLKETQARACQRTRSSVALSPPPPQAPNVTDQWRSDWRHASAYVAKEYKDPAVGTREAFERDVVMQQEAKLWGARFDALHPPKPVDFLQAFLIQLVDRPGQPLFACECVTCRYVLLLVQQPAFA